MDPHAETIAQPLVVELLDAVVGSVRVPDRTTLEAVNWRVALGDFWVVAGRAGSGKSDLLATMAGLQRPLRGTHRLFGRDVVHLTEKELLDERLRVGLVFEMGGRLFSHLTVAENVALPLRYHRGWDESDVEQRVETVLEATGLTAMAQQTPAQLVRAWHPRVGLARALALNPEVLLLDNPLGGLNPQHVRWWFGFLAALASNHPLLEHRRMTLVVTCDYLRPWLDCGRQFAMINGRCLQPLGDRAALAGCEEPLLRELIAAEFATD